MKQFVKRLAAEDPVMWIVVHLTFALSVIPLVVYGRKWEVFALVIWCTVGGLCWIWSIQMLREDWPRFLDRCRWRIDRLKQCIGR